MIPAWAQRISDALEADPSKSAAGLARACGIKQGSVSGWLGKGKATKMISGDNLVAAAAHLGVSPEWIMTGREPAWRSQSQGLGFDVDIVSETVTAILDRNKNEDLHLMLVEHPERFVQACRLYVERTSDVISERQLGIKLADLVPLQPKDATGDEREEKVSASGTSRRSMGKGGKR